MINTTLLGHFCDTLDEAQSVGESAFPNGTDVKLRVTDVDWKHSLWVCVVDWYKRDDRRPCGVVEVRVRQWVLMPGRTIAKVQNVGWDAARSEVFLVLEVRPREW